MALDAVISDHANNERSFNHWLQDQKKEMCESQDWFQKLTDEEKVNQFTLSL